jgi:peptidoglycan-N-acetylglucosamine deacetylase
MSLRLPEGARMAVAITWHFDAHSAWTGAYKMTSPAALSRGEFGAEVGCRGCSRCFASSTSGRRGSRQGTAW